MTSGDIGDQAENIFENFLIERPQTLSLMGFFKFTNVKIINRPNATIILNINIALRKNLLFKSTPPPSDRNSDYGKAYLVYRMKLFVRPFIRGGLLNLDYTCFVCRNG